MDERADCELDEEEVIDALPVLVDVHPLERVAPRSSAVTAQTAAVAVTSFVAGAATAALVARGAGRLLGARALRPALRARPAAPQVETLDIVATRSLLVDVHVLHRQIEP